MKPHALVAMPYGVKPDPQGVPVDFNRIYEDLLRPALEDAGCEVFRADEEQRAGDIRTDLFQELLVADLVVADLTLDNPNVWYELGVRHALRARGVVLVQGPRPTQPFDLYTDRTLRYALAGGVPDPATVAADRARLAAMARATLQADVERVVSPVYTLLPHLREPPWRELLLSQRNEFSAAYDAWRSRMEVARQKNRPGDLLVLADETPTRALWLEARLMAGGSLVRLRQYEFALEQLDAALAVAPDDQPCRQRRAVCLGRLGRHEEARECTAALTRDFPGDADAWTAAARVEKDAWVQRWCRPGASTAQMREAAAAETALLEEAIATYVRAFTADPSHHYAGINALTLSLLLEHLGGVPDRRVVDELTGGVRWAALSAQRRDRRDYWARATFAELCLLTQPKDTVVREHRAAVAAAGGDWFALDSTRQSLGVLRDLGFRPEETAAALSVVDAEVARSRPPFTPRQVLLFSGHMMDAPDRPVPRFPPALEAAAARRMAQALEALGAGPEDLALSQAAAGGDLLFLEACRRRGVHSQVLLPFEEPAFIERSVLPSSQGEQWRDRFYAMREALDEPPRIMPDELGPVPAGADPYERCNLWLLHTALAWGVDRVRFVCLWNGSGADGPGGTRHMLDEVKRRTGRVTWIDTRTL